MGWFASYMGVSGLKNVSLGSLLRLSRFGKGWTPARSRGVENRKRDHPRHREMATSRVDGVKATLGRRVGTFRFFLLDLDGPVAQEEVEDVPPVLVAVGPVVLVGAEESENVMRARRHTREVIDALRLRIVSRLGDAFSGSLFRETIIRNINSP